MGEEDMATNHEEDLGMYVTLTNMNIISRYATHLSDKVDVLWHEWTQVRLGTRRSTTRGSSTIAV